MATLTLVQRVTNQSASAVASLTGTWGTTPVQNHLLVATANSDATLTMSSSGWGTPIASVHDTGLYQWYKLAGASESLSVTVTPGSSASTEIVIEEWSNNLTTTPGPQDQWQVGSQLANAATVPTGTTGTTAQADEKAIAAFGWNDSASTVTMNSYSNSFVEVVETKGTGGTSTNLAVAEIDLAATGTVTCTGTLSSTTNSAKSGLVGTYPAGAGGAVASLPSRSRAIRPRTSPRSSARFAR